MAENALLRYLQAGQTSVSNLLLHHYHDLGMSTGQLMVYLEFKSYLDRGILDPDIRTIAQHLGTDDNQVFNVLHQMTVKQLVVQKTRQLPDGKEDAIWDFTPLLTKLADLNLQETDQATAEQATNQRVTTFNKIEAEFGRTMSPMEMQIINDWLDRHHYPAEIIDLALRQAVMNSALSLQYMDRILRNWQRQGLKSARDVQEHERQFEERKSQRQGTTTPVKPQRQGPKIPIFKMNGQH